MTSAIWIAESGYHPGDLKATLNAALAEAHARAFRRLLCRRCVLLAVTVWTAHWLTGVVPAIGAWITMTTCVALVLTAWAQERRAGAWLRTCLEQHATA